MPTIKRKVKNFLKHLLYLYRKQVHKRYRKKDESYPEGINLLGNIRAEIGLGQSCRLLFSLLLRTDENVIAKEFLVSHGEFRNEDHSFDEYVEDQIKYDVNIIHMEPPELIRKYGLERLKDIDGRYNIGFWLWELERLPKAWIPATDIVDEIWTPSEFVSNAVRAATNKPVYTVPYAIDAPCNDEFDRTYFGLPKDQFLYLVMYDSNSTMDRKNPIGAINAYMKAFANEDPTVGIVVKINNVKEKDLFELNQLLGQYHNVYYLTKTLSKVEVNSLIKDVDVFISLHRAEGFGLVMAEAMLNGTPCVATNWSSNTEFMDEQSACMVDYKKVLIRKTAGAYEKGMMWAEPDVDEAAGYIRRLYEDRGYYEAIRQNGVSKIIETLNSDKSIRFIESRIRQIRNGKNEYRQRII